MANLDVVEILSQLDFLVAGPKVKSQSLQCPHFEKFKAGILSQLVNRLNNVYTVEEITDLFLEKLEQNYEYPKYNIDKIFIEGSYVLGLDENLSQLIRERVSMIVLNAPRCKRSRSTPSTPDVKDKGHQQYSKRMRLPARSSVESHRSYGVKKKAPSKKKAISEDMNDAISVSRSVEPHPLSIVSTGEIDETPCHSPILSAITAASVSVEEKDDIATQKRMELNTCSVFKHSCSRTSSAGAQSSLSDSELADFKERCKNAEQECEDLRKQMRQIESSRNIPKATSKAFQQINALRRRLNDRTDMERYFDLWGAPGEPSTKRRILSHFQAMKNQFPTLVLFNGIDQPLITELYGKSTDLDDLLFTVLGANSAGTPSESLDNISAFETYELIQGLTGAAIHLWIFRSDFCTPSMRVTPLLQQYREFIATSCGLEKLCEIDVAVHRAMIEENCFKEVTISHMSTAVTERLINALQPLFDQNWEQRIIKKLKYPLKSIMYQAVQIRSESLVGNEDYESIWHSVGSMPNEREMEMQFPTTATKASPVRLTICPGLQAFRKEKGMVRYHGFGSGKSADMEPQYVIPALVLD